MFLRRYIVSCSNTVNETHAIYVLYYSQYLVYSTSIFNNPEIYLGCILANNISISQEYHSRHLDDISFLLFPCELPFVSFSLKIILNYINNVEIQTLERPIEDMIFFSIDVNIDMIFIQFGKLGLVKRLRCCLTIAFLSLKIYKNKCDTKIFSQYTAFLQGG